MRYLSTLSVGDCFRPAHPKQTSLNDRHMDRGTVYKIARIYEMTPNTVIAVLANVADKGFWSLGPKTPVLLPQELDPSEKDVLEFLQVKTRLFVVGYKVLWNGKTDLRGILTAQAIAGIKLMFVMGKTEYTVKELRALFDIHFERFYGRQIRHPGSYYLRMYRRTYVDAGVVEELLSTRPLPRSIIDANLQDSF